MKIVAAGLVVLLMTGCASTRLEESLGSTWRTGAPENAVLGAYGIRTVTGDGIIFTQNGKISNSNLKTRPSEARTVSFSSTKEAEAEISKEKIGKLNMTYSEVAKKGYKVVITRLGNTKEIADILPIIEDGLDEQYLQLSSLRFITGVAQIYDHSQTTNIDVSGSASVDALEKFDGKVVLKGNAGKDIQLNYDDGATVAYTYARICWNADGTISYMQEEAPNPWYLFWSNSFDCAKGTYEEKPL